MNIGGRKLTNGEALVSGGAVVGLIASFLPWYSLSYSCSGSSFCGGLNTSISVNGFFHGWGFLYSLAVIVAIAYAAARMFAAASIPPLPMQDWMIFTVLGCVMLAGSIMFWLLDIGGAGSASGFGYSAGPGFGLFIAILSAAAVAAGGFLKKADPQPATAPMNMGAAGQPGAPTQYAAPPPPAPMPAAAPPMAPPPPAPPAAPPAPAPPVEPPAPPQF